MDKYIKYIKLAIPFAVGIIVYLIGYFEIDFAEKAVINGAPQLTHGIWIYLSIFLGVIIGLILEPIPPAFVGLIGVAIAVFFKVGPAKSGDPDIIIKSNTAIDWGLSGFANNTVWLIFAAFAIGLGYQQSGLGKRLALALVQKLGKSTLGLGYAIALTDGILAPFIPSNTARSGGVIYPIVSSIPPMFDSYPDKNPRKIGGYIMWVSLTITCVTSSMFLTGLAPNLLAVSTAHEAGITQISWLSWFIAFLPAGILLFALTPLLCYIIYPPEAKGSPKVVTWAKEEYTKLGSITIKEKWMIVISVFALVFWILSSVEAIKGSIVEVNPTTTAVFVIIFMLAAKIISWNDFLSNKPAWNVLTWFATLVALAGGLRNVGFLNWLSFILKGGLENLSPVAAILGLVLAFYLLHYFFASTTAHVSALLLIFIAAASAIEGVNVYLVTVLMMLSLGIMGIITPYGTGPSPVYFGSGYIKSADFWRLGTIFGLIFLVVFLIIEVPWVLYVVGDIITPSAASVAP
ncbi:MAG: DASS family sodium-coupled anion symporter [Campylobacteraceae bacterium]|jgi:citrate:succinate antiporter/L-tartrate/succinate antiporter|nr:DASS family sodium-coupled anion symporter [Campylobacteraceae bacterium]